jgi:aryl-alcohol dehydrogenase-like predicted oxidoreductase
MLSGKYLEKKATGARYAGSDPMGRLRMLPRPKLVRLKGIADKAGMSMTMISLAWVAGQPGITSPIIGARSKDQLKESVAACQIKLSERVLKQIDEIFKPGSMHVEYYNANFGPNARPL